MVKDHLYFSLQFNFNTNEEAEEAKHELKENVRETYPDLECRIFRKKNRLRFQAPYDGFFNLVSSVVESEETKKNPAYPTELIAQFMDMFDVCLDSEDIEAMFYWHVNFEED